MHTLCQGIVAYRLRLRIPKSLHAFFAHRAKYEGMSLNSFVAALLAEGIECLGVCKLLPLVLSASLLLMLPLFLLKSREKTV